MKGGGVKSSKAASRYGMRKQRSTIIDHKYLASLDELAEYGNERLCEGIAEDEFRTDDQNLRQITLVDFIRLINRNPYLRRKALEQSRRSLILNQILKHLYTRRLRLEISFLNTCLDSIERSGDGDGSYGSCDRCDEVLDPGCF